MGTLTYADTVIEFDDRVLTHLQIVIVQKLRRGEAFSLSWRNGPGAGLGRGSVWLSPAQPLRFQFADHRIPEIDADWLGRLSESANSSRGLIVVDAHGAPIPAQTIAHRPDAAWSGRRR